MDDLLTVRQLEELLQIDRVTIYRMLNNQGLQGFKVGGRWRFRRTDVETWLTGQRPAPPAEAVPALFDIEQHDQSLPVTCMASIESIFAEACGVAAFTAAPNGVPLTPVGNPCAFCALIQSTTAGRQRCEASWRQLTNSASATPMGVCHVGLRYQGRTVEPEGSRLAMVIAGEYVHSEDERQQVIAAIPALASAIGLDATALRLAAASIYQQSATDEQRLSYLLQKVTDAFLKLYSQRAELVNRLQRIATIADLATSEGRHTLLADKDLHRPLETTDQGEN